MPIKNLIFIEAPEQIPLLFKENIPNKVVIALTPHAGFALHEAGILFKYPEEYYDRITIQQHGFERTNQQKQFFNFIDDKINEDITEFQDNNFKSFSLFFRQIKILDDACWLRIFEITTIFNREEPTDVYFFTSPTEPFGDLLFYANESLYGKAINLVCEQRNIHPHASNFNFSDAKDWHWTHEEEPQRPKNILNILLNIWNRGVKIKRQLLRLLTLFHNTEKPKVLELQIAIEDPELSSKVHLINESSKISSDFIIDDKLQSKANDVWASLFEHAKFRDHYTTDGIFWLGLVDSRINHFITDITVRAYYIYRNARDYLKQTQINAIFLKCPATVNHRAICQAAIDRNIPVIILPHSVYGFNEVQMMRYLDWDLCSNYFVGSPGMEYYVNQQNINSLHTHVTGYPPFETHQKSQISKNAGLKSLGLDPSKPTILFLLSNIEWNTHYLSYRSSNDRSGCESQKAIIDQLATHTDIQLILKGHPSLSSPITPIKKYAENIMGERFAFVSHWGFGDMLDIADVFIVDLPSTSFLQMVKTEKSIFVYNDSYSFIEEALPLFKNRVIWKDDIIQFCDTLGKEIKSGQAFIPHGDNQEFYKMYANSYTDGYSSTRVATAVADIAKEHQWNS